MYVEYLICNFVKKSLRIKNSAASTIIIPMQGLDTVQSLSVEASGFTKTRALPTKSGENISSSVGEKVSDLGAGLANSWYNISTTVQIHESVIFGGWSGQFLLKYFYYCIDSRKCHILGLEWTILVIIFLLLYRFKKVSYLGVGVDNSC